MQGHGRISRQCPGVGSSPEESELDKKDGKPRRGDVDPVLGICLVTSLMVVAVAVAMKADGVIFISLAVVLTALAVRLRQGSS
jgi:hypothetical protein